ncbi:MAG: glycosyltransferase, partial [Pseudomonadota bacterium]
APRTFENSKAINLLAIGRLVHKKGFDLLIEAVSELAKSFSLSLNIVGDGQERTTLGNLVKKRNLSDYVRLSGWSDDVGGLLDNADIFVLPSRDEPFGIVCLEAMARGVPIVATRTQGPREILDERSAVLVDVNSSSALEAGIAKSMSSPQDTYKLADVALNLCRENYTPDVVVGQYAELYTRLIQDSR